MKGIQLPAGLHPTSVDNVNNVDDAAPRLATQLPDLASVDLDDPLHKNKNMSHEAHAATRLPTELLYDILDRLDEIRDIAACALACSAWSARASEYLYRKDQAGKRKAITWALLNKKAATIHRMLALFEEPFRFEDLTTAIITDNDDAAEMMLANPAVLKRWRWHGPRPFPADSTYSQIYRDKFNPSEDKYARTPLIAAVARRNLHLVEKILAVKGVRFSSNKDGCWSPLSAACTSNPSDLDSITATYRMLDYDCTKDLRRSTDPVHKPNTDLRIIRALLKAGSKTSCNSGHEKTSPLLLAAVANDINVMELLLSHGADVDGSREAPSPLLGACESGHLEAVKLLLEHGADVFRKLRKRNLSGLHITDSVEIAELLLTAGLPVDHSHENAPDSWTEDYFDLPYHTPLEYAVGDRRTGMITFLLSRGADPQKGGQRERNNTLNFAVQLEIIEAIPALYHGGVDPYKENRLTMSALDNAVNLDRIPIVKLLLELGADFTRVSKGYNGRWHCNRTLTPKRPIAFARSPEMIDLLLEHSGSLDDRMSDNGKTLFHQIIEYRKAANGPGRYAQDLERAMQTLTRFVELGADIHATDDDGWNALHYAVNLCDCLTVDQLVKLGADVDKPDAKGTTPLMRACSQGYFDIVKMLIDFGADIHATKPREGSDVDDAVDTAMDVALRKDCGGAIHHLAKAGADLDRVADSGNGALRSFIRRREKAQRKMEVREKWMAMQAAKDDGA